MLGSRECAPEATRPTLEGLQRKTGTLLDIYAGIAHASVVGRGIRRSACRATEHAPVDARTRGGRIALAVSAINGCS
jgi:hypothetical protein